MAGSKNLYSRWVSGNLYFYTAAGVEICHFDGTARQFILPSGAVLAADSAQFPAGLTIGGAPAAAAAMQAITKAVAAYTDTTAKDTFTVTVPNAAHAAVIEVDVIGVLGAGGAIGAGEGSRNSKYQVVLARTAGVNAVATASAAIGGAEAHVAGAASVTSVVVTLSAIAGAVGAANTFTIKVAITKSGGASDNHTAVATARILNQNAAGVTIA